MIKVGWWLLMTLYWNTITDRQTNGQIDNTKSRVAFATEKNYKVAFVTGYVSFLRYFLGLNWWMWPKV